MKNALKIDKNILPYNKKIKVEGDKSLSIRWVLLASQASGVSKAYNLLMSDDVLAAIESIKKLGISVKIYKIIVQFMEMELMDLNIKKEL